MAETVFLTVSDVAKRYAVSKKTIYLWVNNRVLPAFQPTPNAALRFKLSDLERFEKSRTV